MRVVLPKAMAEGGDLPLLNESREETVVLFDPLGTGWPLRFKFWPNKRGRMYVLEGARDMIEAHALQVGETIRFLRREGRLEFEIIRHRKEIGSNAVPPTQDSPAQDRRHLQRPSTVLDTSCENAVHKKWCQRIEVEKRNSDIFESVSELRTTRARAALHSPPKFAFPVEKSREDPCTTNCGRQESRNGAEGDDKGSDGIENERTRIAECECNRGHTSSATQNVSRDALKPTVHNCTTCKRLAQKNREMFDELQRRREELHFLKAALVNILGHPPPQIASHCPGSP